MLGLFSDLGFIVEGFGDTCLQDSGAQGSGINH